MYYPMEKLIFSLYGFWFWLTRKYRTAVYDEAATALAEAHQYLWNDYATRASTIDRGWMLPQHVEALAVLERHTALTARTSSRFASLRECIRFIAEELSEVPASSPLAAASAIEVRALEPVSLPTLPVANPMPSFASFAYFWHSDKAGPVLTWERMSFPLWGMKKPRATTAQVSALSSAKSPKSLQPQEIDLAA
jgi:hypothetical protein